MKLRQAGAAPTWARGLAALVSALSLLAASAPAALASQHSAMAPNSVKNDVEAYDGAQFTAPADGRIRGYDFAFEVTEAGPVARAKRLLGWDAAGDGQRLVGFKLRVDRTPKGFDHEVQGAVIADGGRIPIPDSDLSVVPREYGFVASVPAGAREVALELSAGGYTQTFSLTQLRRVGPEPIALYRDPLGPEVVRDNAGERTLRVTDPASRDKGSLTFNLERVRLSFFTPPEPVAPADDPSRAFLIVEADVHSPDSGEAQFASHRALPASAVTATLADGTVIPARHAGPEDDGYMSGSYFFDVPADIEAARITVRPGTFEAYRHGEPGAEPTPVKAEGAAAWDIEFTPGGAAKLPPLPKGVTATTAPPDDASDVPASEDGGAGSGFPLVLLVVLLGVAAAAATALLRRRTATPAAEHGAPPPDPPDPLPPLALPAPFATLAGPGAGDAARAAILDAMADDRAEVVVLDTGSVEKVLDYMDVKGLRMVGTAAQLAQEVEASCLAAARSAHEAGNGSAVVRRVLAVAPAGAADVLPAEHLRFGIEVRVLALGGQQQPVMFVEEDGTATLPDGTRGRVPMAAPVEQPVPDEDEADAGAVQPDIGPVEATAVPDAGDEQAEDADGDDVPAAASGGATFVEVLGRCRIVVGGKEIRSGLRKKARELLVLLAVRPQGVTQDAAIEALWPDADPQKAAEYLRQAAKNLRKVFRPLEGPDGGVIDRDGPRYLLTDRLRSVDVREFEEAARAAASGDAAAARRAIDLYRGELAEGWDYPWAEADRERLRRTLLDTISKHAEACRAAGDLAGAEEAINRALAVDPYSEPLYRDLMELHRQQGREDAVRRTYARVEGALAEIGLKPEPSTTALRDNGISRTS